jgi:hypothetical protein
MSKSDAERRSWLYFSAAAWVVLALVLVPFIWLAREPIGALTFGRSSAAALGLWTGMLVVATISHFFAITALFTTNRIATSNLIEMANTAGVIFIGVAALGQAANPVNLLIIQSVGMMVISAVVVVITAGAIGRGSEPIRWREMFRMTLSYGPTRAVIPFLELTVLSLAPWLIRRDLAEAGYMVIALNLAQIVQVAIVPIAQVSSIVSARLMGSGSEERLTDAARVLLGGSFFSSLFIVATVLPWADELMLLWLTDPSLAHGVATYFRYIAVSLVPLALYYGVKGIIEVRWIRPFNLYTLLVCVMIQVAVFYAAADFVALREAIGVSVAAGFFALGVMSVIWMRTYLPPAAYWGLGRVAAGAAVVFLVNLMMARVGNLLLLVPAAVVSAAIAAAAILIRPAPFVQHFKSLIVPGSSKA